jgi:hypothetical protein
MSVRTSFLVLTLFCSAFALAACSDAPSDEEADSSWSHLDEEEDTQGVGGNTSGLVVKEEHPETPAGGAGNGDGDGDDPWKEEACAAEKVQSDLEPVHLVFLLDQSGSMGDGEHGQREEKWDPVTQALEAFFADPKSAGLTASLTLFPDDVNKTTEVASTSFAISCDDASYETPVVTPRPLPDATAFSAAIAAVDPPNEFGTPTMHALAGTANYAVSLANEGTKVAIVLVTDGEPAQCGSDNQNIDNTAAEAAAIFPEIPTYVIGVGRSLNALNTIAVAGGTDTAFIVDTDDPDKTRSDLLQQVQLIRGEQISCEVAIPEAPAGEVLDPAKVNVELRTGEESAVLSYNAECVDGAGWRYDNEDAPSKIELCNTTCETVQSGDNSGVNVLFGCATREIEIR